ncbi:MAG: arginine--tRNA ligase, partial [Mycobacteriales bacterium]
MTPSELSSALLAVVRAAVEAGEIDATVPAEVRIERPRHRSHGDYASSVALQLAKTAGSPPREVADRLAVRLR